MIAEAKSAKKIWTEAELQSLPEDGYLHEVVNGELVMSPKNDFFHGRICTRLSTALNNFVTQQKLGVVLDSSTGFWMHNRNCRAPDISFVSKERLVREGFRPSTRRFFPGAITHPISVGSVSPDMIMRSFLSTVPSLRILSCSRINPYSSASGRGGQPDT